MVSILAHESRGRQAEKRHRMGHRQWVSDGMRQSAGAPVNAGREGPSGALPGPTTGQTEQPKSSRQPRRRVQFKIEVSLSLPPTCCARAGQTHTIQVGSVARLGQTERTTLGRAIDSMGNCALSLRFCAVRQSGMMRGRGAGWIQRPDAPSMFTGTKNHSPHL